MSKQQQAIDEALRRHQWRSFVTDVKYSWWIVALLISGLIGISYWFASPYHAAGTMHGAAVGGHVPATETGRAPIEVRVRLETGDLVSVTLPRGQLYRSDVLMELRAVQRDWWPRTLTYQFVRYTDDPPSSAPQTETAE